VTVASIRQEQHSATKISRRFLNSSFIIT